MRVDPPTDGDTMIVVKIEMWPKGDASKARVLSIATLARIGVAKAAVGVTRVGERAYTVRLLRDVEFGGPDGSDPVALRAGTVWREGSVRGHTPGVGQRGTWDLLGGALKVLLGNRLNQYVDGGKP